MLSVTVRTVSDKDAVLWMKNKNKYIKRQIAQVYNC